MYSSNPQPQPQALVPLTKAELFSAFALCGLLAKVGYTDHNGDSRPDPNEAAEIAQAADAYGWALAAKTWEEQQ
jgi:hypothetical protein